ncbi:MAG: NAD(P)-dependent oxidoreductase [Dehalococcoidia bacterium]
MAETPQKLLIDRKERLRIAPQRMPKQDPAERVHNWDETSLGLDVESAKIEAYRCIQCPAAPCIKACPVHNDIPGAFLKLENGDVIGAALTFRETSNLPEICGRICPQESLCEGHCVVGKNNIPVQIGKLEFFATDYQRRAEGFPLPDVFPSTGRSVAIIGAGPAGLAVAEELVIRGHRCVVYDAWPEPGGILLYGIPSFKLSKQIVTEKIEYLSKLGVEFVQNTFVGRDISLATLIAHNDAVFLGIGAGIGGRLRIEGEDLPQVYEATDFLVRGNVSHEARPVTMQEPVHCGERVVVIGGGDTSMDCVRTARRLGAGEVTCVYRRTDSEMRGREEERRHAREEGVQFQFLTVPRRFLSGEDGGLKALVCERMELGEPDESGRRRPMAVPGSSFEIPCDVAVVAIGYAADPVLQNQDLGLELDKGGLVLIDRESGRTNLAGVFAGGDDVNGADLVVTALADGRRAAQAMDRYLRAELGEKSVILS